MNKTALLFLILLAAGVNIVLAQADTTEQLTLTGFADFYYSYDFAKPSNHEKPDFLYNHKRHNELNANLILGKLAYTNANIRANVGIMFGNYAQYNLANEPSWAQMLYEANAGVKLSGKNAIWLDAGIMPSHIGFESAVSADCWTLTRSLLAENSPYYETGLKLAYTSKNEKVNASFLLLNGWQKIKKPDAIQTPSIGFQIMYKPSSALTLNYSNFMGTDQADSLKSLRTYHNVYAIYEPGKRIGIIVGFDIGTDQYDGRKYGCWYSPVMIVRWAASPKIRLALRAEYYNDTHQIIMKPVSDDGFNVSGLSANVDYKVSSQVQFRMEGKLYHSVHPMFGSNVYQNYSVTSNLTFYSPWNLKKQRKQN